MKFIEIEKMGSSVARLGLPRRIGVLAAAMRLRLGT